MSDIITTSANSDRIDSFYLESQPQDSNIYGYCLEDLQKIIQPTFRTKQVYHWLYHHYVTDFKAMKNIPQSLQGTLNTYFLHTLIPYNCSYSLNKHSLIQQDNQAQTTHTIQIIRIEKSQDGTKKYLFQTQDNLSFESVCIKMRDKVLDENGRIIKGEKYTFCLSSQIGCAVGCVFCSTAKGGFMRNLNAGEIVEQVVFLKRDNNLDSNKSINIVFMGMGEPLLNLKNVAKAIRIISDKNGLNIATRRQTISTSGIAPQIEKLGAMQLGVQIALSLHAVDDALRSRLIPMNKVYNIAKVLESLRKFPLQERRRILFEYLVIKNINDDLQSAKKLVKLLHGFKAKVNLIPFNPHEESDFQRPENETMQIFADFLYHKGIIATIRESKGIDISAACGQLREKALRMQKYK